MCRPIPAEDATATSLLLALPVVLESGGPRRGEKQQRSARPAGRKEGAEPGLAEGTSSPLSPATGVLCDLGQVTALSGLQFLLIIMGLNGPAIPRTTS